MITRLPSILRILVLLPFLASAQSVAISQSISRLTDSPGAGLRQATASSLSFELTRGVLQLKTPAGPILSNLKLRFRFSDGTVLAGDLEAATQSKGTDKAGEFDSFRFRLKPAASAPAGAKLSVNAELEFKHYLQPDVLIASLNYSGPALAPVDGVQLIMGLDAFARGMALKQLKLYWTSPVFVSDHRLLSPANQLLLWRQLNADKYHLMVPLAGDGMIATLGVSEIDYRYEFRVSSSSNDPSFAPARVPLFAYAASNDPYRLPQDTYKAAFASQNPYGQLRWDKEYPEIFRSLGWCSWNTYYKEVTEERVINSVRSLRDKNIPVGFVLVDDGWLSVKQNKLSGFDGDPKKFPNGMAALAGKLRGEYKIPHVGVWHTFQGYWDGIDKTGDFKRPLNLFTGIDGKNIPDPREGHGESFYADWYSNLKSWGYDFVKVDNQGSNGKFTNGFMPLFSSGSGQQRNLQEAAVKQFSDQSQEKRDITAGLNVINCMEMTLENAFSWRYSNLARNSDDYLPDSLQNAKEHIHQNAYNAYWTSNFAYPDWDMFQSHDPSAEIHAVARAISGGPVYFTDEPGKEHPEILHRLIFSDGRLLMLDAPGQVTEDLLLRDPSLEATPLKVFGRISRPGISATIIAAFNVNKSAQEMTGSLKANDVYRMAQKVIGSGSHFAVYKRGTNQVALLSATSDSIPFSLGAGGFDLFTIVSVDQDLAVFGLLDKYLGPAAVLSSTRQKDGIVVRLQEFGDFGVWLARAPVRVSIDDRNLPLSAYTFNQGLMRIPRSSFGDGKGERVVRIVVAER